jgi:hypothetical protein
MTSATKIRANRRNAQRSTGPRSRAGKTVAARNSRRHGLTLPVLAEPSLARDVVALARRIETSELGREADAAGHVLACRIAETMIDLKRVRLAKLPLTAALHADPRKHGTLTQLWRLDRYERCALGRRKRAIREFGDATLAMRVAAALARRAAARIDKTTKRSQRRKANDFSVGVPPLARPHPEGARTDLGFTRDRHC